MSGTGDLVGFCPVDKPVGPTSHDIVRIARKALQTRRVGHTGTLDPFASGLLLLGVGRATRLIEYLSPLDKEYEAVALLGVETSTLDPEGDVVAESTLWRDLDRAGIERALTSLEGRREQIPPAYSAKKLQGERAYARARRGERVELSPVRIHVREIELLELELPRVRFRVRCSTGTYVRALARELGDAVGVGAHLTELRRTAIGPHHVRGALDPEALTDPEMVQGAWISPLESLGHLPNLQLPATDAERLVHGQSLELRDAVSPDGSDAGPLVVVSEGEFVCVATRDGHRLRPSKVFRTPAPASPEGAG